MQYHKQKFLHNPDQGTFGDCHRTVIACLLDKEPEEVPHWGIHYFDTDMFSKVCNDYLASQGLMEVRVPFQCELDVVLNHQKCVNPGVYYMLTGKSRTGTNHVVVCLDDKIIHDPSLTNSGIIAPCIEDDHYWIGYLVSTKFLYKEA